MDDVSQMPGHFPLLLPYKRSFGDDHAGQRKVRLIGVQPRDIQDLTDELDTLNQTQSAVNRRNEEVVQKLTQERDALRSELEVNTSTIDSLNKRNDGLKEGNYKLMEQIATSVNDIDEEADLELYMMKERLNELVNENTGLAEQVSGKETGLKRLQLEIERLEKELRMQDVNITAHTVKIDELTAERDRASLALLAEIAEREQVETRLETELEARKADLQLIAEKDNALEKLTEGREGVERLPSDLQDELTSLKKDLLAEKTTMINEIGQVVVERDAALERLKCGQMEIELLQVRISDLETNLTKATQARIMAQALNDETEGLQKTTLEELDQVVAERDAALERLKCGQTEKDLLEVRISDLETDLTKETQARIMAQELKDQTEGLQQEALEELENLQRELSAQKETTTNEISRVVTERDAALERLKCGQTEKELLQVQISDLETDLTKETQARIVAQELKDEAERLQREALDESEILKRELSAQKATTTNEISRVVTERDAALERLKCGQTEKELLQVQISDLETDLTKETQARIMAQELKDEADGLQRGALEESENLKREISQVVVERDAALERLKCGQTEKDLLEVRISDLETNLTKETQARIMAQELKDQTEGLQQEALEELENLQREVFAQKETTTNEISQVVAERDAALERLKCGQTEKELLQVQISDLETDLAKETQARIMAQKLKDDAEGLQKEALDELEILKKELLAERATMSDEVNQLKSDNLVASESCASLRHEKERLLLEVGRLTTAVTHAQLHHEDVRNATDQKLRELERQLDAADEVQASLTEKAESLRLQADQHESERNKLLVKCQEYESERIELLAKYQQLRTATENRQGSATPYHSTGESLNLSEASTQQMSARAREKMPAHLATPQTPIRRKTRYVSLGVPGSNLGTSDVESESIPHPGLYSRKHKSRPSLADRLRYISPVSSRPSTPALAFSSPLDIVFPNDAATSQPLASGSFPSGGTDVEMESIPPLGLYSGTYRNRPPPADQPQYLSPIPSRSSTPAPITNTAFTSSLDTAVANEALSSQPPAPGLLPNGRLLASASITPAIGTSPLNINPASEFAGAADGIQNASSSNTAFSRDFIGAPSSTGESSTNPISQPDQYMSESIYHRVRRVEDQVKEISVGMKTFQATHSNLTPPKAPRAPRTVNDNALMADVRKEQQKLLGIKVDSDIMLAIQNHLCATTQQVADFAAGRNSGPTLNPIQHDFDTPTSKKSLWNQRLAVIFAAHLISEKPVYQGASDRIVEHFLSRIQSLRAIVERNIPKTEDVDLTVFTEDAEADRRRTLRLKRIRTRLISLYQAQFNFTEHMMTGGNGDAWALLHELVCRLGPGGQSEDESDEESDIYTPVELYWRNPLVQRLLDFIDKCREQYARTPSGKRLPGNQFRTRERSVNPSISQDSPPSGLPINLYMDTWYTALGEGSQAQLSLKANPILLKLPVISVTTRRT